jgi:hypothetical protein
LGAGDVNVTQIGGQQREQSLDILAFSVPRRQPMNRRGVPQIVESWLTMWATFAADAAMYPEPLEGTPEKPAGDPGTEPRHKKWGVVALRVPVPLSLLCVVGHHVI